MGDQSPPKATERRRSSARKMSLFNRKPKEDLETVPENKSEVRQALRLWCVLVSNTPTQGLVFKDICVDVASKRILWSVSGHARPGAILAILGPSGTVLITCNNLSFMLLYC